MIVPALTDQRGVHQPPRAPESIPSFARIATSDAVPHVLLCSLPQGHTGVPVKYMIWSRNPTGNRWQYSRGASRTLTQDRADQCRVALQRICLMKCAILPDTFVSEFVAGYSLMPSRRPPRIEPAPYDPDVYALSLKQRAW